MVLQKDNTYVHFYAGGSSGKSLTQEGGWKENGSSIMFSRFVAWDLYGPLPNGVTFPDAATSGFSLEQSMNGSYEIKVDPDRDEKFVQIERCTN